MDQHTKNRSFTDVLLHVGPMSESIWVNTATAAARLGMGVLRIFIFARLLADAEMGVWGTATMGMAIASPLINLGTNQGFERYVSVYEAAGRLRWFFKRGFFGAVALTVLLTLAAACFFPVWREVLFPVSLGYSPCRSSLLAWLVILNTAALAIHCLLLGFGNGLRMFRLVACVDILFAVLTTFGAASVLYFYRSATVLLIVHLASVWICFLLGAAMLYWGVNRITPADFPEPNGSGLKPADNLRSVLVQLGRFGFVGLIGATTWQVVTFVSYYMTYITEGKGVAGKYTVMLRLAQPVYTLAIATWAVVYTHTASAWQHGERKLASERMDVMYRRVMTLVMLGGWTIILSEPIWSRVLGAKYCGAGAYLPGLMLMFAAMGGILCQMVWARIFDRQWAFVITGFAAGVLNAAAYYWLRKIGAPMFASLSAGLGVYAGSVLMTVFYFSRWKISISPRGAAMMLLPAMFLISGPLNNILLAAAVSATICYFAFTPDERKNLLGRNC